jgi:ABC-2 type transport system ATP-binding protein
MSSAIAADHVAKRYGEIDALHDVTLSVEPGELFGLVGPDGAGKTTFLRVLACLLRPTGGTARVAGIDVVADPAAVKRHIGYMSQRFSLSETLTVLENLVYVAEVWGVPPGTRRQRIARLLEFSRLGPFQDRLARNLSGGMKQKLSLAACLIHQPRILLLDEPTSALDIGHQQQALELVARLRHDHGLTVVSAMHDLTLAGMYATGLSALAMWLGQVSPEMAPLVVTCRHWRTSAPVSCSSGSR